MTIQAINNQESEKFSIQVRPSEGKGARAKTFDFPKGTTPEEVLQAIESALSSPTKN